MGYNYEKSPSVPKRHSAGAAKCPRKVRNLSAKDKLTIVPVSDVEEVLKKTGILE